MVTGRRFFIAIASTLVLGLIVAVYATHVPEHTKQGDCLTCHLNDPTDLAPDEKLIFIKDLSRLCSDCHPNSATLSHPVGFPVSRSLPPEFVLDWKGEMTCATCHFFHKDPYPFFLRSSQAGKEFCLQCHDMDFFMDMVDGGESLITAHLVSGLDEAVDLGYIDTVSLECLICHDGVTASEVSISVSDTGVLNHQSGSDHPIGTDYAQYANFDTSYTPPEQLPAEVLLVDGKVGCPTCHVPYDEVHGALVITQQNSKLCFTCHRM